MSPRPEGAPLVLGQLSRVFVTRGELYLIGTYGIKRGLDPTYLIFRLFSIIHTWLKMRFSGVNTYLIIIKSLGRGIDKIFVYNILKLGV